jgi:hypothetical protein
MSPDDLQAKPRRRTLILLALMMYIVVPGSFLIAAIWHNVAPVVLSIIVWVILNQRLEATDPNYHPIARIGGGIDDTPRFSRSSSIIMIVVVVIWFTCLFWCLSSTQCQALVFRIL